MEWRPIASWAVYYIARPLYRLSNRLLMTSERIQRDGDGPWPALKEGQSNE